MGIGATELHFILQEHLYRPISGEIVTIGKQSISLPPTSLAHLLGVYGLRPKTQSVGVNQADQHLAGASMDDQSFFDSFTTCRVHSADISPYEGATHVFDICGEVPAELRNRFDFVFDGGSLDNVFDPVRMLSNMAIMTKPGGRMFITAWSNSHPTAYAKITPDWLMDYCAVNEFADCKLYIVQYQSVFDDPEDVRPMSVWQYSPLVEYSGMIGYECSSIITRQPLQIYAILEKGTASTNERTAVQKHYRGDQTEPYLASIGRFNRSSRPPFTPFFTDPPLPPISSLGTVKLLGHFLVPGLPQPAKITIPEYVPPPAEPEPTPPAESEPAPQAGPGNAPQAEPVHIPQGRPFKGTA